MAATPYDTDEDWESEDELDLAEDESLPWLESTEPDDARGGVDTGRMVLLGVLALLALGLVGGGIWFFGQASSDEPPADGSLIAAPEEPYKTPPMREGGKVFPGTGDASFAVGEGLTREGRLADTPQQASAGGPSIASTITETDAPAESPADRAAPEPVPANDGTAVQVGAFPSRADAEDAWARMIRQTEALLGVRHRVVEARVDIGTVYRLQALPGDRSAATRLCQALKDDGLACFVK
ncbi:SPOR domain-containing protein [Qipengyuania sp. XHP0207]|uniref:SPOR domain-containing protein n=1 Tax=Qipengyuania sp. XHP0207 TaxID=3038078 RepID=UPI00241DAD4B|nr:SPOR domain-containing protein [Qipengyuania sp. XHP0207]MDG5749013.1 SPOR domain-containing protein [Qipengyuania sp. XHP0207]